MALDFVLSPFDKRISGPVGIPPSPRFVWTYLEVDEGGPSDQKIKIIVDKAEFALHFASPTLVAGGQGDQKEIVRTKLILRKPRDQLLLVSKASSFISMC